VAAVPSGPNWIPPPTKPIKEIKVKIHQYFEEGTACIFKVEDALNRQRKKKKKQQAE
jgi:hypothetical protein